jgi:hypothetical protein
MSHTKRALSVLIAAAWWATTTAAPAASCSEDAVKDAVALLTQCNVTVATYTEPKSCVKVVTDRYAFANTETLAKICAPKTSGRCLDALLVRFAPAAKDIESGLLRLATDCRNVNPFCAVDFIAAHSQFDPDEISKVCALE